MPDDRCRRCGYMLGTQGHRNTCGPKTRGDRVWCHICDCEWDSLDPMVHHWIIDGTWECVDESECFGRRAALSLERDYAQAAAKTAGKGTGDGLG